MQKIILLLIMLSFSQIGFAGIETDLIEAQYRNCTVRVYHDATPSASEGTIIFRSNKSIDGLFYPCDVNNSEVTESLSRGLAEYKIQSGLKPATSIMVGRISRFPWVRAMWEAQSKQGSYSRLSYEAINELVNSPAISAPFEKALNQNGLSISNASCEKVLFYKNGAPMDALCWFVIDSPDSK